MMGWRGKRGAVGRVLYVGGWGGEESKGQPCAKIGVLGQVDQWHGLHDCMQHRIHHELQRER
jgi:hypothetical protein